MLRSKLGVMESTTTFIVESNENSFAVARDRHDMQ